MPLPSNYTPLGYIESSGKEYIDTGFKPNQNTRVVITLAMIPQDNTTDYPPFGARIASGNADYSLWNIDSSNTVQSHYGSTKIKGTVEDITAKTKYDKNKNELYVNDQLLITNTAKTFQPGYNMYLFACNNAGTVSAKSCMRLYSCQIYDNDTLVRDFVPCRSSYTNAGLYDLVNGKFYANAGSGSFVEGEYVPEVEGEYEILHIPVSSVYACGNSNTDHYPEASGTFNTSTGVVLDGTTISLASPISTFSLSTDPRNMTLPSVGSYIKIKNEIYQITSSSYADDVRETGYYTPSINPDDYTDLYYDTSIYIYNLNKVILGVSNAVTSHYALIDNVQRNISEGFAFVNGTGYEIDKGRTLVDGTGQDIKFSPGIYIDVETWNQAEGVASSQGTATVEHNETETELTGRAYWKKGTFAAPSSGRYAGITWHILNEETGEPYLLQVNDIVEWEVEATTSDTQHKETTPTSRILFFTNPSDTWASDVADYDCTAYETTHLVDRECYMEFDCHVPCSNATVEATLTIKKLTINGQDVWVK